ncbi:hypothetical protein QAD02_007404 [Eretmocerus hayati]|uniref:Uncharacterized protein n=1 Tax=Eretmocerus hayati TaxID=131215 RepID=A0ACC2N610_9HYME|nr:hypothetical protein QAD02_007404 [Eretmocerus hayati]
MPKGPRIKNSTFQEEWLDPEMHPGVFWVRKSIYKSEPRCSFSPKSAADEKSETVGRIGKVTTDETSTNKKLITDTCEPSPREKAKDTSMTCSPQSITHLMNKNDVVDAEILWTLDHASNKSSVRSASNSAKLFPRMFPDSLIAQKFQMQKDELSYSNSFGLGPYFRDELISFVRGCNFFAASFDGSLDTVAQKGQMDIILRFFFGDKVVTRYLTSTFLGHATASDLLKAFIQEFEIHQLDLEKMVQLSMDGPNGNKKFQEKRDFCQFLNESADYPKLIDTGTCILHIVNGSYKRGHNVVEWTVNDFLRAIYYMFKNFPTRRADYKHFTCSQSFQQKFCFIRWLENSAVVQRALEIIDSLKVYVKVVEKNPPESNNYHKVAKFLQDILLKAKLSFMISISQQIKSFLTKYQTESPIMPFLMNDLYQLLKNLMARVVKTKTLDAVKNVGDLLKVDLKNVPCLRSVKMVDIGFAASASLNAVENLKEVENQSFRLQCQKFIIAVCQKLRKDSSLSTSS